jgi:hypothetical protein
MSPQRSVNAASRDSLDRITRGGPRVVVRTMPRYPVERGLEVYTATTDDNGRELQRLPRTFVI